MKATMYHYVRPDGETPPQYHYLDRDDFRAQLDFFADRYGFVEKERFLAACTGEATLPEDGVLLTFDDGLVDHYEWVLPELADRSLWGIFYVPTGPLATGDPLDVHRIHALLGSYGGHRVLEELAPRIEEDMVPEGRQEEFRETTYARQDNAASTTRVKRLLNYFVAEDHRTELLDRLVADLPAAEIDPSTFYVSDDQLRALQEAGMLVGSHTVSHRVLSTLSSERQRVEIVDSFDYLENVLDGLAVRTFCYPYGGSQTFTDETVEILRDVDCEFAFNVESRDVEALDVSDSPLALPRYDCNEFEHGDASGSLGTPASERHH